MKKKFGRQKRLKTKDNSIINKEDDDVQQSVEVDAIKDDDGFTDEKTKRESRAIVTLSDGDVIKTFCRLSPEEKAICAQIVQRGSTDYLRFELNWTSYQIKLFMAKKSIRAELDYLRRAYSQREGIQERAQFFGQLRINTLVPAALKVVARALQGDKILDDGSIERAPSRGQFDAALDILNRANVHGAKYKGDDTLPTIDARSVNVTLGEGNDNDPVDLSSSESRERVRSFLGNFLSKAETSVKKKRKRKED